AYYAHPTGTSRLSLHDALPISFKPSFEQLGQAIRYHRVTTLWLTATLFAQMVEHCCEALQGVRQLLAGRLAALRNNVRPFARTRSEEHTSELQSLAYLVCRLLL